MRNTTRRAFVLYFVIVAFFCGLGFMMYNFFVHGSEWTSNLVNQHIYKNGEISSAGTIFDRNGTKLVYSEDGVRIYNDDKTIRKAMLHAVGDNSSFIATGVQYVYSSKLSGYDFVNGVYNLKKYNRGNDINLTLDADICKTAYEAMDGRKGTIAVYNYKTGAMVCMVSTPSYDPQNKPDDIDENSDEYEGVYLNRFVSGLYTPGSIFKVVTAISAIENIPDIYSQTFECTGEYATGDGKIICSGVHGTVDFEEALNHSCNSAFAQIAIQLGQSKLMQTAGELGFNTKEDMDQITVSASRFDVSKTTKTDLGWAGIGQYTTMVNPYHMLTIMGAIANNGVATKPYFVQNMVSPDGKINVIGKTAVNKTVNITPEIATQMKKLLRSNVVNYYSDSTFPGLKMCGKTGTAEVEGGSHAWFVGFSQREDAPYAVICVVEKSGSGLSVAGEVVNEVMQDVCN